MGFVDWNIEFCHSMLFFLHQYDKLCLNPESPSQPIYMSLVSVVPPKALVNRFLKVSNLHAYQISKMKLEADPKVDPKADQNAPQKRKFIRHEYAVPFDESILHKNNLEIIEYLKEKTVLFKDFSDDLIKQIEPLSKIEKFIKGDEILIEATPNEMIFFLMRGVVGIYKGGDLVLKLQRKGDIFGEMSLISNKPCSASVIAENEVVVFSIQVRDIGADTNIDQQLMQDSLYKLYAVILADKLAMTTFKAIDLERKVKERTMDLRLNNEKLRMAKEKAIEANRAKSEFLSNMSHELRTPMHQILSYAQLGIKRFCDRQDRALEYLKNISSSGYRMMNLVNDLLDLSELGAGRVKYTFNEHDIFVIIKENVASINYLLEEKRISIAIGQPNVPTKIICDYLTISQAIQKVLSNSIKFTPKDKSISISFDSKNLFYSERLKDDPEISSLLVSIKDEGPGIPEDELESIFDKFTQSSKTKTGAGGTGLGLAICNEIIIAHQGKIWVENSPEAGATFNILLPYEQQTKARDGT